ncbi:FkbM family methyltransferase [Candidatus Pacearchaeota archaeon]|nr:FkbM family methyltransferase [Candidatus Pacearchaeota archaeon]
MVKNTAYKIPIKERLCVVGEKVLDECLKLQPLQRYVNRRANNKYGSSFVNYHGNSEIDDVFSDYRFNDIRKDDIVLDIGANVGAFSLFVSRMVKHVYAVEPMLTDILNQNILLNKINNITVLDDALGKGMLDIPWTGCENRQIMGRSLGDLINLCGGHVDFLKMDCEGAEWCIEPYELAGIRRIEAEIHNLDGKHDLNGFLEILDESSFTYDYSSPRSGILFVHAFAK